MNGRRTEHRHHTPEQVREVLREALAIVEELAPPVDLRVVTFTKAAEFTAAKNITIEAIAPGMPHLAIPGQL